MKKIMKLSVSGILIFVLSISFLASCGCSKPKSLSGIYIEEGDAKFDHLEFFSDGKFISSISHNNYYGDYSIDGNRIILSLGSDYVPNAYYFRVKGKKLELSENEEFSNPDVYVKK